MTDKREERRRQRELDEGRKAGTIAPELDDEGNVINPHIPNYIKDAPCTLILLFREESGRWQAMAASAQTAPARALPSPRW